MNTTQKLHQAQLNEWAILCKEQKESGLTVRKWCEEKQISIHAYNYWKHLLKTEVVDQMLPDIVQLSLPVSQPSAAVIPDHANCANRVNYPTQSLVRFSINGTVIEIENSVPEHFLRTLVRVVQHA